MIWTFDQVDTAFVSAFAPAGAPDQQAIDAFLGSLAGARQKQHAPKHEGVARYYSLLADDPRVVLCCVGMPLDAWGGGAMMHVGTRTGIGEFTGNRHLIGQKCLHLKMQPLAWLKEPGDQHFRTGSQALEELSFQRLDLDRIVESQQMLRKKYQWK